MNPKPNFPSGWGYFPELEVFVQPVIQSVVVTFGSKHSQSLGRVWFFMGILFRFGGTEEDVPTNASGSWATEIEGNRTESSIIVHFHSGFGTIFPVSW